MKMTTSDWASWVQAVGTIVAVAAAAGIAVWQSRKQHGNALALHKEERRYERLALAKSLLTLAQNCKKAAEHFAAEMGTRETIYNIASGEKYFDFGELNQLQNTTSGIPLYRLPDTLVSSAMALAATVRQLNETIKIVVREHRKMDAEQFSNAFQTLSEISESLALTCSDIELAVTKIETDG